MLQQIVDSANANSGLIGIVLCLIFAIFVFVYAIDESQRRSMIWIIVVLCTALNRKDREISVKDDLIKSLKSDLFIARFEKKTSDKKYSIEIEKLKARIAQLEQDKKQLSKWGMEK